MGKKGDRRTHLEGKNKITYYRGVGQKHGPLFLNKKRMGKRTRDPSQRKKKRYYSGAYKGKSRKRTLEIIKEKEKQGRGTKKQN